MDTREAWTRDPRKVEIYEKSTEEFQTDMMFAAMSAMKLNNLLDSSFGNNLSLGEKLAKLVKDVRVKYPARSAECDKVEKAIRDWQEEDEWHEPTSGPPSTQLDRVLFQSARTKKYAAAFGVIIPFVERYHSVGVQGAS